ncbi:translation elongation factor Ts [Neorickettsia helminthoeca str. Oregon]|uniref:Elongation factor Ts n=1 Tax=Neorickettsia helminthoeca str. Oregon TaxID=1286528 RepID=X5H557_9RICK|nr:translation elongation factor Ts [Neorickettsia helminthoeca str. Oregon]
MDLKRLSKETSAGLVHCKKALAESGGDYDKAREILKEFGHAVSVKKSNREASDGVVGALSSGNFGVMIELNCETDFVARNDKFQQFADLVLQAVCENKAKTVEECLAVTLSGGQTVRDAIMEQISIFRENIVLSKCTAFELSGSGLVGVYIHNKYTENLGKIGVVVALESNAAALQDVAKNIAIQIMSECPQAISIQDIDPELLSGEKEKYREETQGKPDSVAEKIVQGKLNKFYKRIVLLEQPLFADPEISVKQYLDNVAAELSGVIKVLWYRVFTLGDAD